MTAFAVEVLTSVCVVVGGLWTLARWIGKVDQNTVATEKLTVVLESYTKETNTILKDHEHRLTILETK